MGQVTQMNAAQQVGHVSVCFQSQNTIGFVKWHRYSLHYHSAIKTQIVETMAIVGHLGIVA